MGKIDWTKLSKYKYISFDIFDTLVLRNIQNPKDIFYLVEDKMKSVNSVVIDNFHDKRIECEKKAVKKKKEITIYDIYELFYEEYDKMVVDAYRRAEIEMELLYTVARFSGKELYNKFESYGYKIVIISDMYLPKKVIEKLLNKNGYRNYYKLYVSCEVGKAKRNGELFDYVIQDLQIKRNEIFHIGDSLRSDIFFAGLKGVKSYWLKNNIKQKIQKKCIEENISNSLIANKCENKSNSDFYGYSVFGPLVYGFENWLIKNLSKENYDYVFFFSRDGFFLKKVFEHIAHDKYISKYIYVSRKALQTAILWKNPDYMTIVESMYLPIEFTYAWFLEKLGVSQFHHDNKILQKKANRKNIKNNVELESIYEFYKEQIINNSKKNYEGFLTYLKLLEFKGNIAIVDVGWAGNMQYDLNTILKEANIDAEIHGFYLGVEPNSKRLCQQNMQGYLYSKGLNEKEYEIWRYGENILETFLMAPHGTTLGYRLDNEKCEIIQAKFEYENAKTYKEILAMQKSALEYVNDYSKINCNNYFSENIYYENYVKTFTKPSLKQAEYFGNIQYWDNEWMYMAKPRKIWEYLNSPSLLKEDLKKAPWKIGFMKRIFMLNFSYGKILKKIKKCSMK